MDLQTRFWDSIQNQAVARYLTSEYLGHTAVGDLFPRLMNTISELNECVLVQIGMDGPSTNLALYNRIKADRLVSDLNGLIDLGSCLQHVIHGALGTGVGKSGWKIKDSMKSAHYMLHDSPARCEDYINIAKLTDLPLPFVGHRWVEDNCVAERLISI